MDIIEGYLPTVAEHAGRLEILLLAGVLGLLFGLLLLAGVCGLAWLLAGGMEVESS